MRIEPYLSFPGNCEDALAFYQGVFGGSIVGLMRYGDVPAGDHQSPPELREKVMHATLKAGDLTLYASDWAHQQPGVVAERVWLSIAPADAEAGRTIFEALADGGSIVQPYSKQFWGATFGSVTDRFGIGWMINAG